MPNWIERETSTHQDHVIAHVVGSTVLGYFVFDESIYLLLDIGFIWQVYLDGEMGLLPYSLTIRELEAGEELKQQLQADSEVLLGSRKNEVPVERITPAPVECLIQEVQLYADGNERRLLLIGEENGLSIETSCNTRQIVLDAI